MNRGTTILTTLAAGVGLLACGGDSTDPDGNGGNGGGNGAAAAAIEVASGDAQSGKTLEPLEQPLVALVTDADGAPVPGANVTWSVTAGGGSVSPASSTTNAQGRASTTFTGGASLGETTVQASVAGVAQAAAFAIDVSTLVIRMQNIAFVAPGGGDDATVPLGTPIEWVNTDGVQHTVTSTDEPPGGAMLDSDFLNNGQRFPFTPEVTGTWTYRCDVHPTIMLGATLTVTAGGSASGPESDDPPSEDPPPGDPGDPNYP